MHDEIVTSPLPEVLDSSRVASPDTLGSVLSSIDKDSSLNPSYLEELRPGSLRVNWQLKAILPVGFVLLAGLLLFTLATRILARPGTPHRADRRRSGSGSHLRRLIGVLAYLIHRPMVELQEKFAFEVSEGNLDVAVSFSRRNDEIGDLGRNFNHMMQQLRESREEIERLHRTQMSRAEHLATLGELAAAWPTRFAIRWPESPA
jgi:HAMP domain-containing protein